MLIDNGAVLAGLHVLMRPVLRTAENIWKDYGREEGVTVTCGMNGIHSAASWHYYGLALDFRTRYFSDTEKREVYRELKAKLPRYDVIAHTTHIHVEPGNQLAAEWGLLT